MPRFVVLAHDWPSPHFDLLLESGRTLKAWRLAKEPVSFPVDAERNFDHRLLYLDFEGRLGGDRGSVSRWDYGEMEWLTEQEFELKGKKLSGWFRIANCQFSVLAPGC